MAETALGVFASLTAADAFVEELRAIGVEPEGIRIVSGPKHAAVDSATSTPLIDFEAALALDLRSMGATEAECESYLTEVRRGHALVFISGTVQQADAAMDLMNRRGAVEVEEFAGVAPVQEAVGAGGYTGGHDISSKENRLRARTAGARIFSW